MSLSTSAVEYRPRFSKLTQCLVERDCFTAHPFRLIDAGCSGGIARLWRAFEPTFEAIGIDPLVDECERLNRAEANPRIRYLPTFLGLPDDHEFVRKRGSRALSGANPWNRLSAALGSEILTAKVRQEEKVPVLNAWKEAPLAHTPGKRTIDQLAADEGWADADFIKIDVDGHDLDVLLSAERLIRTAPVLGLALEVNFYGTTAPTDHTFHNTDRLMRAWGFELFDLTLRRYSAAALPAGFEFDCPAQTISGRPYQGDALYLRDPQAWNYHPESTVPLDAVKLLKLACLFELFGLPDHAAELLRDRSREVAARTEPAQLLDLLANQMDPTLDSYAEYLRRFTADPASYYASRRTQGNAERAQG